VVGGRSLADEVVELAQELDPGKNQQPALGASGELCHLPEREQRVLGYGGPEQEQPRAQQEGEDLDPVPPRERLARRAVLLPLARLVLDGALVVVWEGQPRLARTPVGVGHRVIIVSYPAYLRHPPRGETQVTSISRPSGVQTRGARAFPTSGREGPSSWSGTPPRRWHRPSADVRGPRSDPGWSGSRQRQRPRAAASSARCSPRSPCRS
jgi:hypothetical protein